MFDRVLIPRDGSPLAEAVFTQARPLLFRWMLGSVAERVLRHAAGPLLVVRVG